MTDRNVSAEWSLGSGGDAYAVGRAVANGERRKEAAQRRTCDEKRRQGKNRPHGALQSDDGAQAERGAVSGARPPAQARTLLLARRHRDVARCRLSAIASLLPRRESGQYRSEADMGKRFFAFFARENRCTLFQIMLQHFARAKLWSDSDTHQIARLRLPP